MTRPMPRTRARLHARARVYRYRGLLNHPTVYKSLANGAQFSMWHMAQWTLMAVVHSIICVIVLEARQTPFYSYICAASAPGLRSSLPRLHRDRARCCSVTCAAVESQALAHSLAAPGRGTGPLTAVAAAPGHSRPLPRLPTGPRRQRCDLRVQIFSSVTNSEGMDDGLFLMGACLPVKEYR